MKSLFIYDKSHIKLDEIMNYSGLTYGWTLNDIDTLEFNIGLEDNKCTQKNLFFFNHIELVDEKNNILWGGIIAGLVFQGPSVHVTCLDYLALLKGRLLNAKTYATQTYGSLLSQMLGDINAKNPTGVSLGSVSSGALQTTRIVQNTDFFMDKIKEYCNDTNYDFDVNVNRSFNFYLRKGQDKAYYQVEYGGQADNILEAPSLSQDILSMSNRVYAEILNNGSIVLSSLTQDAVSQSLYPWVESVASANNGITVQSTLDNLVNGQLQRTSYPINSFSIKIKDSTLCPFNDINVGDAITVSLPLYFGFKALLRILQMKHDESTGERDITFGQIILRPQPPIERLYKK
jgi:hypothetical protein